jgi:hypothetical protein
MRALGASGIQLGPLNRPRTGAGSSVWPAQMRRRCPGAVRLREAAPANALPDDGTYQLSEDPAVRRAQLLLAASRRLRLGDAASQRSTSHDGAASRTMATSRPPTDHPTPEAALSSHSWQGSGRVAAGAAGLAAASAGATALIGPDAAQAAAAGLPGGTSLPGVGSSWAAMEELLAEAAYTLSQQVGQQWPLVLGAIGRPCCGLA